LVEAEKKEDTATVSVIGNGGNAMNEPLLANETHMGTRPGSVNLLWIIPAAKDFLTGKHDRMLTS
jgi:hypothetical protein